MDTERMLRELIYIQKQEKDKTYDTCSTNWHSLLVDVIIKIDELMEKANRVNKLVKQIDALKDDKKALYQEIDKLRNEVSNE